MTDHDDHGRLGNADATAVKGEPIISLEGVTSASAISRRCRTST